MSEDQNIPKESTDYSQRSTEENPKSLTESQLPIPSDPVIRADTNSQPQTQKMEVHHPHHVTHKKKWTEYLLEFFMLFLAVFLGFVAENIREHAVERNRARQLSRALIVEMQKDSSQIRLLRDYRNRRLQRLDSFYNMLNQPTTNIDRSSFYRIARQVLANRHFSPATGTSNELKNAGYLRYFIHTQLATLLSEYEAIYTDCGLDEKIESNLLYDWYYPALLKVCNAGSFDSLFNHPGAMRGLGISAIKPDDIAELQKVVTILKYLNSVFIKSDGQFDELKAKQVEIINHLNEKF